MPPPGGAIDACSRAVRRRIDVSGR